MNELSQALAKFVETVNGDAKSLGEMLQRISPDVWKLTIYQVQVEGFRNVACWWAFALLPIIIGLKFHFVRKSLSDGDSDAVCYYIGTWILMCLAFFIMSISAGVNYDYIVNPQYEAMHRILGTLLRHGC